MNIDRPQLYYFRRGASLSGRISQRSEYKASSKRVSSISEPPSFRNIAHSQVHFNDRNSSQEKLLHVPGSSDDQTRKHPPSQQSDNDVQILDSTKTMEDSVMDRSRSLALQQRKLAKIIDHLLLRRTQLQHQQATVDNCRSFLDSSLTNLDASIESWLPEGTASASARAKGKKKQRKRKSKEAPGESLGPFIPKHASFSSSVAEQTPELVTVRPPTPDTMSFGAHQTDRNSGGDDQQRPETQPATDAMSHFRTLLEDYRKDYRNLLREETKLKALSEEVSNLDYELKELNMKLQDHLALEDFVPNLHAALRELNLRPPFSSPTASKAGTATPPLVAKYFDEKGNAGIFRERLQEEEYWHHEGLIERALITDRGDVLDVTDEQFQQNYDHVRRNLDADIAMAEAKAAALKQQCEDAGLDIDKYRRTVPSIEAASTAGRTQSVFGLAVPEDALSDIEAIAVQTTRPISIQSIRASNKIDSWLRNVSNEDIQNAVKDESEPLFEHKRISETVQVDPSAKDNELVIPDMAKTEGLSDVIPTTTMEGTEKSEVVLQGVQD